MTDSFMLSVELQKQLKDRNLKLIRGVETDSFLDKSDSVTLPSWPEFMLHDMVANRYWSALISKHADFQFALVDSASKQWIAVGNSIPVYWAEPLDELPDQGWDWALKSGMESDDSPNLLCALAIQILPEMRGQGLSALMVKMMKEIGHHFGFDQLIAPVRPNKKCDYPLLSMETYVKWSQGDAMFDPWLRIHQRLGARLLKVCPHAMHISASIESWQQWTGLTFKTSGEYVIPGALNTVNIDIENDCGDYVEPNVWMIHNYYE